MSPVKFLRSIRLPFDFRRTTSDVNLSRPAAIGAEVIGNPSVQSAHVERKATRKTRHWEILLAALVSKLLIFGLGAEAYLILANEPINGFRGWMSIVNRWDAVHYLNIAENGYVATGPGRNLLAFFPGYPWLIRACSWLLHDYSLSALFVSTASSLVAAVLLFELVRLDFSFVLARRAVWFFLIFPTSYFLHFAYAESLFIALVLGSILAARKDLWAWVGILGAAAGLTRINGLILIPVLGYEAARRYYLTRRFRWLWLSAMGPALGFGTYLLLNLRTTGNALTFLTIQREHWSKQLAAPWIGISETINSVRLRGPAESQLIGTQELIFMTIWLIATLYCCSRLRHSYAIWMAGNWLLCTSTSFIYSVPRYTLTMFPLFILLALAARGRESGPVIAFAVSVWSLMFLALFTALFVRGQWAF